MLENQGFSARQKCIAFFSESIKKISSTKKFHNSAGKSEDFRRARNQKVSVHGQNVLDVSPAFHALTGFDFLKI